MAECKKQLLIASSCLDEAMTRCLSEHRNKFKLSIDIVTIDELLNDFHIDDELSEFECMVRWYKHPQHLISNQTHLLFNRILWIPETAFRRFRKKDQAYAQREFEAYLGYSLSAFQSVHAHTVNGVCETIYSLPEQWHLIKKHIALSTPNYYWGPKSHCFLKENLVYSSIHDLFNWSISATQPNESHIFCFEKPSGEPVFILSLGQQVLITSNMKQTPILLNRLTAIQQRIRRLFGYFVFETLLFIDEHDIRFGCVNLALTRSATSDTFEPFVMQHFMREYLQCLP